jgi:hypothetical protein
MEPHDDVRVWRPEAAGAGLCMHGTTSSYAVDPVGEYVVGMVLAGAMEVRRGGERHVFVAGDLCAWDPSARHAGRLAQRIRVARAMLERGVAVGEVAQQTGFFDQSHLHRHFRGTLGITPGQYSAAVRSGVQDARGIAA